MKTINWIETFGRDLRYAARTLRKSTGFTSVAVLSLAFGIGANLSVFTFFDALLVKMLPVRSPEQLFALRETGPDESGPASVSYPQFVRFRGALSGSAELTVLTDSARFGVVTPDGTSEAAQGQLISGEYFTVLGVRAAAGRLLAPEDVDGPAANPVAVISYGYWQRRYAGRDLIGETLRLNGTALTIVGVAPRGFFGATPGQSPDLW